MYSIFSPLPVKPGGGDCRFPPHLSLCPSVHLSVHSVSVHSIFRTFLSRLLRYWQGRVSSSLTDFSLQSFEIFTGNLVYEFVMRLYRSSLVLSRSTYFYRSYCPLLKFSFPDFSLQPFKIFNCNLVFKYIFLYTDQVSVLYSLTYVSRSYYPFLKFSFPDFSMQFFLILTLNRSSSNWSVFVVVMPLKYLLGPVGDRYCFSNTFRILVLFIIQRRGMSGETIACLLESDIRPTASSRVYMKGTGSKRYI